MASGERLSSALWAWPGMAFARGAGISMTTRGLPGARTGTPVVSRCTGTAGGSPIDRVLGSPGRSSVPGNPLGGLPPLPDPRRPLPARGPKPGSPERRCLGNRRSHRLDGTRRRGFELEAAHQWCGLGEHGRRDSAQLYDGLLIRLRCGRLRRDRGGASTRMRHRRSTRSPRSVMTHAMRSPISRPSGQPAPRRRGAARPPTRCRSTPSPGRAGRRRSGRTRATAESGFA